MQISPRIGCAAIASLLASLLAVMPSGCAVGPDFKSPRAPDVSGYTAEELPRETVSAAVPGGNAQLFLPSRGIPAQWWSLFRSPGLNRLVEQGLSGSPTLQAAEATLRQAQENLRARTGSALYPALDADARAERQKISGAGFGQPERTFSPFTLYNASVSVSYALDLFGGARRDLESLSSQVDVQRFRLEGARLSLASNIVTAAVQEASLSAQLQALREIVALQEQELLMYEQRLELGAVSDLLREEDED